MPVREESGVEIDPSSVSRRATLTYWFPAKPSLNARVGVFFGCRWRGVVRDSDEMRPAWFPVEQLPLSEMWDDEQYWLPRVLGGVQLTASFTFDDAGTRVTHVDLQVVESAGLP